MCDFCFYVYIFVDLKRRSAPTNSAPTTFQWNYITCSFNMVIALRYVLEDIYVVVLKIYVYVCFIIWKLESVSCFILLSTSIHMNIVVFLVWLLWIPLCTWSGMKHFSKLCKVRVGILWCLCWCIIFLKFGCLFVLLFGL